MIKALYKYQVLHFTLPPWQQIRETRAESSNTLLCNTHLVELLILCCCVRCRMKFAVAILYLLLSAYLIGVCSGRFPRINTRPYKPRPISPYRSISNTGRLLTAPSPMKLCCHFYLATAKHTHGIAVEILSVRLSVCLSNACVVTKQKHLAKKVQL